jgi:hypothetical protein
VKPKESTPEMYGN